jgi:hypothetical protein
MAIPAAIEVLRQSANPLLRGLLVVESDSEIVISGTLPTYYLKQLAQETLRPVLAGRKFINRIFVPENEVESD